MQLYNLQIGEKSKMSYISARNLIAAIKEDGKDEDSSDESYDAKTSITHYDNTILHCDMCTVTASSDGPWVKRDDVYMVDASVMCISCNRTRCEDCVGNSDWEVRRETSTYCSIRPGFTHQCGISDECRYPTLVIYAPLCRECHTQSAAALHQTINKVIVLPATVVDIITSYIDIYKEEEDRVTSIHRRVAVDCRLCGNTRARPAHRCPEELTCSKCRNYMEYIKPKSVAGKLIRTVW